MFCFSPTLLLVFQRVTTNQMSSIFGCWPKFENFAHGLAIVLKIDVFKTFFLLFEFMAKSKNLLLNQTWRFYEILQNVNLR